MSKILALVPETEGRMWSVRTHKGLYLVVTTVGGFNYDVHRVSARSGEAGVDHIGVAGGQKAALSMIEDDPGE